MMEGLFPYICFFDAEFELQIGTDVEAIAVIRHSLWAAMIDLSRVQPAFGCTDLRQGIGGLAVVVPVQFGQDLGRRQPISIL